MNKTLISILALGAVGCTKYYQGVVRDPHIAENGNRIFAQEYVKQTEGQRVGNKDHCLRSVYLNVDETSRLVLSEHCVPFDGTGGLYEVTKIVADKDRAITKCSFVRGTTELGRVIKDMEDKCGEGGVSNAYSFDDAVSIALSWATLKGEDPKLYKKLP